LSARVAQPGLRLRLHIRRTHRLAELGRRVRAQPAWWDGDGRDRHRSPRSQVTEAPGEPDWDPAYRRGVVLGVGPPGERPRSEVGMRELVHGESVTYATG